MKPFEPQPLSPMIWAGSILCFLCGLALGMHVSNMTHTGVQAQASVTNVVTYKLTRNGVPLLKWKEAR